MAEPGPQVYRDALLAVAPRLVSLLDRDPISPTRGSFDRTWWGWKFIDFPTPRLQEGVYPLAVLWTLEHPDNPLFDRPVVLDWIAAALSHWCGMQHADGSFDEAWPNERSLAATAFGCFWVCETLDIVGAQLPADLRATLDRTLRRAGDWLAAQDEPHAFISNHLAAAAAALQAIGRHARHPRAAAASTRLLGRILDAASPEGWLPEYGGADPGYQTHALLYLACIARTHTDPRLDAVLASAVDFLGWFVHPDGGMGGPYGSRNTRHVSPGGFELLGRRMPAAAALARATRLALLDGRTVGLETMDQQNLVPLACSTALAWANACEVADAPPLPRDRPGERHFPQAGLYVRVTDAFFAVVSQHKGVVAVFGRPDADGAARDLWACGWVGRLDGQVISSQPPAVARPEPAPAPTPGPDDQRILQLRLPLYRVNHDVFRPARFAAFRVATLTVARPRAVGRLLKRAVVRRLVTGARPTVLLLTREITLGTRTLRIQDRVTGMQPLPPGLRPEARFTAIHMGSSRYFTGGDTNPEPERTVETSDGGSRLEARWP